VKYFFLAYAVIVVLVIGVLGVRGDKFSRPPLRLFPDMDEQDKVKAQVPSGFFADGVGARPPVAGVQPRGLLPDGAAASGGIPEPGFGGGAGYFSTGHLDGYYGSGMPAELGLDEQNAGEFLRRGAERYAVFCAMCHGESGDGRGITSRFGVPVADNPNANLAALTPERYPDGRLFEVITKGKGNMGGYGHNIPVRDRWAIIAYIHALRAARMAPYAEVREAFEAARAAGKVATAPASSTSKDS
jgi:mono/diheme cytochrome c family protein